MSDVLHDDLSTDPSRMKGFRHTRQWVFGTMLFSALLSLTASFVLSYDAVLLAANPAAELSCNVNEVLSCGAVGVAWQSSLFGFPNAFLGLIAEPVVITIAVASLGGVRFPRWFMFSAQVVYTLGLIFAYWLFYQSMFVIGALCPWCLLVTLSTTLVFMTLLHWNILENNLYLPAKAQERALSFVRSDADVYLTATWVVLMIAGVLLKHGPKLFG
jgi:uncharacterized membrane protein